MESIVRTIEHKGYHIDIYQDPDPENPRDWENVGRMVCQHGRYKLGDLTRMSFESAKEVYGESNIISLPLYLYDHSGITMSTKPFSCPWDSGQVGYIYATKDDIRKQWNCKNITEKIRKAVYIALKAEVELYDHYLTGNVYGYQIRETGGGCWSFYGTDYENNGLMYSARGDIQTAIENDMPLFVACGEAGVN